MSLRIAVLDDYHGVALEMADWSLLADCEVTAFPDHLDDPAQLMERLRGFDVVCTMRERTAFPGFVFDNLSDLKLLVVTGGNHTSAFDFDAALVRGVTVCRTESGRPLADGTRRTRGITDITFGLILALTRNIVAEDRNIRAGGWISTIGFELEGATLGLLGLGRIGKPMADVGRAFGMEVIAWSQNLTAERAAECGASLVSKDELFGRADVVSVHLRLSERTVGLVGAAELALMKPTAYLVNTARGPIVDEAALIEALRAHRIAGAGLDVFEQEPLPVNHPFRALDNTVLTPHVGYVHRGSYEAYYRGMVEVIVAWQAGKPLRRLRPPSPGESRSTGFWVDDDSPMG